MENSAKDQPVNITVTIPPLGFFPWDFCDPSTHTLSRTKRTLHRDTVTPCQRPKFRESNRATNNTRAKDDQNPEARNSSRHANLVKLFENPVVLDYLTELEWAHRHGYTMALRESYGYATFWHHAAQHKSQHSPTGQKQSRVQGCFTLPPAKKLRSSLSSISLLRPHSRAVGVSNKKENQDMAHSIVVLLPKPVSQRESMSSSLFKIFSLQNLECSIQSKRISPDTEGVLASCYLLRHFSNYFVTSTKNLKNCFICLGDSSCDEMITSEEYLRAHDTTSTTIPDQIYRLLVSPTEYGLITGFMDSLGFSSIFKGLPSPVSPLPQENQQQVKVLQQQRISHCNGQQPQHTPRNRTRYCSLHKALVEKPARKTDRWLWDKSEPLGYPALCSCNIESLHQLWKYETMVHDKFCFQNAEDDSVHLKTQPKGLDSVDWNAVFERQDFTSFLSDILPHNVLPRDLGKVAVDDPCKFLDKLRYCSMCGGLPYIPFSFIEFSLNKEIPTLQDVALRLPLPIPTEFFCDGGLRVTACLVTRSRLHEWLAFRVLKFINMHSTVRVYQVCSSFIFPFYSMNEGSPQGTQCSNEHSSGTTPHDRAASPLDVMCPRHNLLHRQPPDNFTKIEPPRLAVVQHRRPYCLIKRPPQTDDELQLPRMVPDFDKRLKRTCFTWLEQQSTRVVITPKKHSVTDKKTACP